MDDRLITGPPVPSFTNRIIILLGAVLVLLAVSSTAWAQPSLSLDSTSGSPGQTVTSTLTVQNNGPAVALQFEVQFDAAKLSPGNVTAGADLAPQVFNAFSPTAGVLRVVVTPVFGPTLPGIHNGILLNLPFAIAANAAGGATALALANVLLSNATAGSVTPGALTNGTLTIQSLATTPGEVAQVCSECGKGHAYFFCDPASPACDDPYVGQISCEGERANVKQSQDQ